MSRLQVLKSALDQMRHFLWFYMQVMTSGSDMGEKLRQTLRQGAVMMIGMLTMGLLLPAAR